MNETHPLLKIYELLLIDQTRNRDLVETLTLSVLLGGELDFVDKIIPAHLKGRYGYTNTKEREDEDLQVKIITYNKDHQTFMLLQLIPTKDGGPNDFMKEQYARSIAIQVASRCAIESNEAAILSLYYNHPDSPSSREDYASSKKYLKIFNLVKEIETVLDLATPQPPPWDKKSKKRQPDMERAKDLGIIRNKKLPTGAKISIVRWIN